MLGGLAAGLGLAWLASSLGLGAAVGQFMLIALMVLVGMALVGWFLRSRRPQAPASPYAFQGAASAETARAPRQYSPDNVGNDASARPWERNTMAFEVSRPQHGGSAQVGSAPNGSRGWGVPHGFDAEAFLEAAKGNFVTLQDAWDRSDIPTLRSMMTDGMLTEIQSQLGQRDAHLAGQENKTDVVMLESQLLGIEDLGDDYMASVEFSGMIREQPSAGPTPFREVWNMIKPKSGSTGWLVAGVQALQ
jgi:predicted lipid-binding transport protein (Tim44 family)